MTNLWRILRELQTSEADPIDLAKRQTDWLLTCLRRNRNTEYGGEYCFDRIDSIQAYRDQVPLQDYSGLFPYIEKMAQGKADILFQGNPLAFEQTGGSSGGSKLIPYSRESLTDFGRALLPWLGNLVADHELDRGAVYLSISPATRQPATTAGGVPIGLPDGAYLGALAGEALLQLSAVPAWVGEIPDIETWQLATLYWLLRRHDLVLISVWSPSFFLQLLQGLDERQPALKALLQNGGALAERQLPADHAALERFTGYLRNRDSRKLWPELKLVSTWMDGSSRSLAEQLQQALPQARFQPKGLLATEGVTTVPKRKNLPVLTLDSGFYEFLREDGKTLCAWELEPGQTYEVVLTTAGGLYRYRSGDLVRYAGAVEDLPVLRFLGRNDLCSDLVGEKLTEAFVAQCLVDIPGFRMLAPVAARQPHYTVIADRLEQDRVYERLARIEDRLCSNPQYAYARKLGQLGPLSITSHSNPLMIYTGLAVVRQRLGEIKLPALLPPTMPVEWFLESWVSTSRHHN